MKKKCFECRQECEDPKKVFCKSCEAKRNEGELKVKTSSTFVIYNKI